jgi:hypothetical protein
MHALRTIFFLAVSLIVVCGCSSKKPESKSVQKRAGAGTKGQKELHEIGRQAALQDGSTEDEYLAASGDKKAISRLKAAQERYLNEMNVTPASEIRSLEVILFLRSHVEKNVSVGKNDLLAFVVLYDDENDTASTTGTIALAFDDGLRQYQDSYPVGPSQFRRILLPGDTEERIVFPAGAFERTDNTPLTVVASLDGKVSGRASHE